MSDTDKNGKSKKIQKRFSHFIPYKTTYDLRLNKRELKLINILMQIQGYEWGFLTVLGVRPLSQRG
ncbi:hypothetical protein [Xenorhabdus miraniensis]|uniref:Uncharacterized protein n=1 Tax=Xenorhabdus miraniensis TaxID=351674 RepID=A0A2D0JJT7_9GAMM|nr:hypothetical protein [Xenorhabdus miraniensis]PHM45553.1 hypothetical protein Xmir_04280 [Xenorhabdus miraniensis]